MTNNLDKTKLEKTGYIDALKNAIDIRLNRQKLYGDGFLDAKDRFFMVMLEEKIARATYIFDNPEKRNEDNYEKIEDTLLDLVNYSLMWLQVLHNRGKK